jgi:hypothetical protein
MEIIRRWRSHSLSMQRKFSSNHGLINSGHFFNSLEDKINENFLFHNFDFLETRQIIVLIFKVFL